MWQKFWLFAFALLFNIHTGFSQMDIDFFEEYFTLNSKHELLSQFVGKWKVTIAYYGANQEEYVSGELNSSLTFSYRILEMNFNLNNPAGLPFEMKYLIGYDGLTKKFFLIILNSLTNEIQILKGDYQKKTNDFIFTGTTVDQKTKKRIPFSMKFFFERENKLVIETYSLINGKEKMISKFSVIKKIEE
ncbi:DUF1579 domain-containing protein [Bacteroidetes/Chlorobi group bacterium Naka2016]|nr:MAG: DUF1579 domain-containing protein [Bacteroidetes/Chlorobi group bacterium Naka2016]